jgi:hypothetical protein
VLGLRAKAEALAYLEAKADDYILDENDLKPGPTPKIATTRVRELL